MATSSFQPEIPVKSSTRPDVAPESAVRPSSRCPSFRASSQSYKYRLSFSARQAEMSSASPIVILTGASRGLGLAILRLLLSKHNARVAAFSRSSPPELEATLAEFGSDRVLLFRGDVAKVEDNKRCVDETVQKWGGVDSVVFNAGQLEPLGDSSSLCSDHGGNADILKPSSEMSTWMSHLSSWRLTSCLCCTFSSRRFPIFAGPAPPPGPAGSCSSHLEPRRGRTRAGGCTASPRQQ